MTAIQEKEERLKSERDYADTVRGWYADDKKRSRLAILRRCAGGTVTQAIAEGQNIIWMYSLFNRFAYIQEESLFLTATLMAFDRRYLEGASSPKGSFGRTMAQLKEQAGASEQSVERRFAILLNADFDPQSGVGELPYRLRQTVRYVFSKEGRINWPQLLADLRWWNDPRKFVQKRWAREFYAPLLDSQTPT